MPPIPVVEGPGLGHGVERRPNDIGVEPAPDEDPISITDPYPLDPAPPEGLGGMAGEGVGGLVVVIVEIEQTETQLAIGPVQPGLCRHAPPPSPPQNATDIDVDVSPIRLGVPVGSTCLEEAA